MLFLKRVRFVFVFFLAISFSLNAQDELTIISPHRKSIQQELIPLFKKFYKEKYKKEISVRWLDQGGTENNLRYLMGKYKKSPSSSGIDVFWGGGDLTFLELEKLRLLEKINLDEKLKQELPKSAAGLELRSKEDYWFASAASSFGIFFNKTLLKWLNIAEPKTWQDLTDPKFYDLLSFADIRHSSSSLVLLTIILLGHSWEEAWKILMKVAGNTKQFTLSSAEPIKKVVTGDTVAAGSIDFYAYAKIAKLGAKSLGFVLPSQLTLLSSDPVAILKGAPHRRASERFVEFILSAKAQKLLILPKGEKDGPRFHTLARMAINPLAYKEVGVRAMSISPFSLKAPSFNFDMQKITSSKQIISDLLATILIDLHSELKRAWAKVLKTNNQQQEMMLVRPPFERKELWIFAQKWSNESFRQRKINEWTKEFKQRYQDLAQISKS